MKHRPSLAVSLAISLKSGAESRSFFAFVPLVLAVCLLAGTVSTIFIPSEFWSDTKWAVSTAVFSGLLAFNGMLMSLGWFAFSKIYEILANDRLGQMLTRNDLLGLHLAFIDVSHAVLICASVLSVAGLVAVLVDAPLRIDKIILVLCLGFTLYGMARAFSATKMMNDLIWEQAHLDCDRANLKLVDSNETQKGPAGRH